MQYKTIEVLAQAMLQVAPLIDEKTTHTRILSISQISGQPLHIDESFGWQGQGGDATNPACPVGSVINNVGPRIYYLQKSTGKAFPAGWGDDYGVVIKNIGGVVPPWNPQAQAAMGAFFQQGDQLFIEYECIKNHLPKGYTFDTSYIEKASALVDGYGTPK